MSMRTDYIDETGEPEYWYCKMLLKMSMRKVTY